MQEPFLLMFSGNVSHQASNNLCSDLCHRSLHPSDPTTKLSITSVRNFHTAKLTELFITSHLLVP